MFESWHKQDICLFSKNVQTRSGAHTSFYSSVYCGSLPGVKQLWHEVDFSRPSSSQVKKSWAIPQSFCMPLWREQGQIYSLLSSSYHHHHHQFWTQRNVRHMHRVCVIQSLWKKCCLLHHDSSVMHDNTAKSTGFFPFKVVLPVMSVCAWHKT
jgi:hypothetical protein